MWTALLIVHGLLAVLLLGAVTHQAMAVTLPPRGSSGSGDRSFLDRFRGVSGESYTIAVVVLFLITFIIGVALYPTYRLNVRTYLQDYRMLWAEGAFEIKEHLASLAVLLLPLYRHLWKRQPARSAGATTDATSERVFTVGRAAVTIMIAVAAWSSFFVGHILNNIRGLFGT